MSRRLLQLAIAIFGFVPVLGGGTGVVFGLDLPLAADTFAGGHYRYLSGLLLGIGLVFWACIPRIERHGALIRALTAIVFAGGLARLAGHVLAGLAFTSIAVFALMMELLVTPALCLWQARISRSSAPPK